MTRSGGERPPTATRRPTRHGNSDRRFDTIVVGGGQAGLAVGYYLAKQRRNFVILDAGGRVGDAWRGHWNSLRQFTPARYDGLPGMPFPAPGGYYPKHAPDYYATFFEDPKGVRLEVMNFREIRRKVMYDWEARAGV